MLLSNWFVFVATFIIFPGVFFESNFRFMRGMKSEFSWYIIVILLMFNLMDTIGKNLGGKIHLPNKAIPFASLARVVFIPTSIIIARTDKAGKSFCDCLKVLNMLAFAFTNGYVNTQCAVKAPAMVK